MKKRIIIILTFVAVIVAVELIYRKGFYEYTSASFDLYRLPLIEPYELICLQHDDVWVITEKSEFSFEQIDISIHSQLSIDSVGIEGDNIIFHAKDNNLDYWLRYNAETHSGRSYYSKAVIDNRLRCKVKMHTPNSIFIEFKDDPSKEKLDELIRTYCR